MFDLRQTIASFEGQSGESNYPVQFQGSMMFSPIITTPLAMKLPTQVAHSPSQPTVPKRKKKRVVRSTIVKNIKTTPPPPVVNLTDEVEHSISTSPIIEEISTTTSTTLLQSRESSPHRLHLCNPVRNPPIQLMTNNYGDKS